LKTTLTRHEKNPGKSGKPWQRRRARREVLVATARSGGAKIEGKRLHRRSIRLIGRDEHELTDAY
jgi:hypothetical protein